MIPCRSSPWVVPQSRPNGCRTWQAVSVLKRAIPPEMERPAMVNQSTPTPAGTTIRIPPAKATVFRFSFGKERLSAKNAIDTAQEQYTRWGALCPGTFLPLLTCCCLISQFLQAALAVKNSTNTGASADTATSCVWPGKVRCCAWGIALTSVRAVACIKG